ncbi:Protein DETOXIFICATION 48 [Ananas comosus]|uniref:Protein DETOXIFICATION n=1 Tax=Ananas comosus TaxID=4615 RepID=A0A199W0B7_ANACO|nr:Protein DETOXIFICATION 48 [Ananas comosus]
MEEEDPPPHNALHDDLNRWPSLSEVVEEVRAIGKISLPTAATGLVLYSRSMISMLFLGRLGETELAGGSLSIGFANITGYSVLSGLAMGMEPICGQAFGARQPRLLGLTLQRCVLLLLAASLPISLLWLNARRLLLLSGQDPLLAACAASFLLAALPDLLLLSILHPIRIYLRSQNITLPITAASALAIALHVPLNYLLVCRLRMGVPGVALAMTWTNLNLFLFLLAYILLSGVHRDTWVAPTAECLRGWSALLRLAVPTCVSVCLEWWWYELMILLCGLLRNPSHTVASMGILMQTTSLVYVFPSALSLGVSTRVGNMLGAGRAAAARRAAAVGLVCGAAIGVAAAGFAAGVRDRWGTMFTGDRTILRLTAAALPVMGLCELGNCPQTAGCGVLRGTARPAVGANINLGSFYLVGMPVGLIMGFAAGMGFVGLWIGLLAAQATCAVLMVAAVWRTDWAGEVERAKQLTKNSSSSFPSSDLSGDNNKNFSRYCVSTDDIDSAATRNVSSDDCKLEEIVCVGEEDEKRVALETDPLICGERVGGDLSNL